MPTDLTVRFAGPADARDIIKLARLDSTAPLSGDALLAESDGRPLAAIALTDGRIVADPFIRTAPAVELLRVRAEQVRPAAEPQGRHGPLQRMRPHWAGG